MLDFLDFEVSVPKQGLVVLKPDFRTDIDSEDLMIRGGDFYAIWDESSGYWSKSEKIAIRLIDQELTAKANELREKFPDSIVRAHLMRSARSGSIDMWHKYVQKQARDSFKTLDKKINRDGDLSVYEIKQVAKALLSVLQYLHTQPTPIIHNEVTILNLMLDLSGTLENLKLIDFGYARFLNQEPAKSILYGSRTIEWSWMCSV